MLFSAIEGVTVARGGFQTTRVSAGAAMTKHHSWGLEHTVSEAGGSKSKVDGAWFLVRALSLACGPLPSRCVLMRQIESHQAVWHLS